jgi:hypothetical protein
VLDRILFWDKVDETKRPEQLRRLSYRKLRDYQTYFLESQYDRNAPGHENLVASQHLALLRNEMQERQGRKILFWARWAVIAAVVVPIAVVRIAEIDFSRLLRAKASQSPTPSPTQSLPLGETPTATEPPPESPIVSETPLTGATPE